MISLEMDLKAQTTKQVLLGLMVSVAPEGVPNFV